MSKNKIIAFVTAIVLAALTLSACHPIKAKDIALPCVVETVL